MKAFFIKSQKLILFLLAASFSDPAFAQTIDYGSLEDLFGEPVTTSATGQPQRESEVPVTMKIITAEDIRRSGATNIPEILRTQSSLSVWNWTRSTYDVNVRGYNQAFSPQLLVLVNGRQIYSDSYGNTFWQNVPVQLEEIRQIEIVEGPNSALFGFNAVSGVVNIITYNPLYDDKSNATVRVGTGNYRKGDLVHTQKFGDKIGIRASAGAASFDDYDEPAGSDPFYDPNNHQFSVDGVYQVTEKSQIRLEANQAKSRTHIYTYGYSHFNNKYDTNSVKLGYTADTGIGIVQANVYQNTEKVKATGSISSAFENKVIVAQLGDIFKIGNNHTFRAQTEYRRNSLEGTLAVPGAEVFYDVYAASGMWNWKILDNLSWTNAVRVDHMDMGRSGPLISNAVLTSNDDYDQKLTEVSYNTGLVWNATAQDTLRLSAARGIRAPSLLDIGIQLTVTPILVLGNPQLNRGVVENYEFGYDRQIDTIGGGFRGSVFYQKMQNLKGGSRFYWRREPAGDCGGYRSCWA